MPDTPQVNTFYQKLQQSNDKVFTLLQSYFFYADFIFDNGSDGKDIETPFNVALRNFGSVQDPEYLRFLVQAITLPSITQGAAEETVINDFGHVVFVSKLPHMPDSNVMSISFLSTEYAVHENLFLKWLAETTSNRYVYPSVPFTRATITVTLLDQKGQTPIFEYSFYEAFPQTIATPQLDYASLKDTTRNVSFNFNWLTFRRLS